MPTLSHFMTLRARPTATGTAAIAAAAVAPALAAAAAAALAAIAVLAAGSATGDYVAHGAVGADNAAPAVAALAGGHLARFAAAQPVMGLTSLILRSPVQALGQALGAGPTILYRLGAFACVLATALLLLTLVPGRTRRERAGLLLALAIVLLGPAGRAALRSGHPEELLAAALATAAVVQALRGRPQLAGVLLAAAIGTKAWATIAALPVLLALPSARPRRRAAVIGAAGGLLLTLPPVIADPAAFRRASQALGHTHLVNALSAWWPLSAHPAWISARLPLAGALPLQLTKSSALALGLLLAAPLAALGWRHARRRDHALDALALLALLGLFRCLADPGPVEYYYVALLVPLAVHEAHGRPGRPLLTALAGALVALTFGPGLTLGAGLLIALSLGWGVALAAILCVRAFGLERAGRAVALKARSPRPISLS